MNSNGKAIMKATPPRNRTSLLLIVVGLLVGSGQLFAADPTTSAPAAKPNIVLIFADQLRSFELGCYGGKQIPTPNMDRLAAEGVRLTHAISTYPICSPYRGMLMTGLYPMRNGMVCNDHSLRPGVPSLAQACRSAGYHTAYIGKWHLDGNSRTDYIPPERRLGFQHFMALECTHDYFKSKYFADDSDEPKYWDGYDAEAQTHSAQDYIREQAKVGPFLLCLSWGPPHDAYIAPKKYMDRIKPTDVIFRTNVAERALSDALREHPRVNLPKEHAATRRRCREWLDSDDTLRKATAGYLAATLALDDYLGELLQTLTEAGILNNTIIVFTSDHGDCLGSHRFYGKDTPFEESISVPLMVRYPAKIPAGSKTDALFSPVDIMPTMLGLARVDCPRVDGLDLSRNIAGHEKSPRDAVLLMGMTHFCNASVINGMDVWRGVRTARYTYARYEDGTPWLLYDNVTDPFQMRNLADDPASAGLRKSLNQQLDQLLAEAGDPFDTKALYDRILREKPSRKMVVEFREANPQLPWAASK
jgi:arylsulfatase A-like enzyme